MHLLLHIVLLFVHVTGRHERLRNPERLLGMMVVILLMLLLLKGWSLQIACVTDIWLVVVLTLLEVAEELSNLVLSVLK